MNFQNRPSVFDQARGKWRGVLLNFGIPETHLRNKHGPCPMCGGRDRFRFDDKDGSGTWICSACGAGRGIDLLMNFRGWDFKTAAQEVEAVIGSVSGVQVKAAMTDEQRADMCREVWRGTKRAAPGDLVHRYLDSRGIGCDEMPTSLRLHPALRDGEGGIRPAMVARVTGPDGAGVTLHRTFLRPDGLAKAEMASPRKLMPGTLPEGACVRLSTPSDALCLAEGIETALAVERLFETPCWATISAGTMAKWIAPDGVESVTICADNDAHFAGQSAAYRLANRLAAKGLAVNVRVPDRPGEDWLDVLNRKGDAA